ncbi:MAG: hypothetical protein N2Z72_01170 [Bacteroidales bacterium]|nr:hypothetical protein [Bacteroidales bacterium]
MKAIFLFLLTFLFYFVHSQDTISIMTYNVLQYGVSYGGCNSTNNNIDNKDNYLKQIMAFTLPDILSVNELSSNVSYHDRFLSQVMNADGRNYYARGGWSNLSGSDITSNVFYNTQKLGLKGQTSLATDYRDIVLFTFYVKNTALQLGDTIFLTIISMHLKAGSYASDITDRENMVNILMNYLNARNIPGNYFVLGDFNFYNASEAGFQKLINHPNTNIRFYDPVNKIGDWHDNSLYAPYHTQSTHASDNNCHAPGGMDDRFDFILFTLPVFSGSKKVKYIPGSYETIAQDGNHFNKSLLDAPNPPGIPLNVLNALYNNSDHLPVRLKVIAGNDVSTEELKNISFNCWYDHQTASFYLSTEKEGIYTFILYSLTGQKIFEKTDFYSPGIYRLSLSFPVEKGFFILGVFDQDAHSLWLKFFK